MVTNLDATSSDPSRSVKRASSSLPMSPYAVVGLPSAIDARAALTPFPDATVSCASRTPTFPSSEHSDT
jgi:hypothetical protein